MAILKKTMDELQRPSLEAYQAFAKKPIILVLDNIRSMQNVGAIFRSADAFCIQKIVLMGITPCPPHRDIRKASLGAEQSVEWEQVDTAQELKEILGEDYSILSIEQTEPSILLRDFDISADKKYALVLGNEVSGVSQEVLNVSDAAIEIKQCGTKHSLNVATTAGVVLYQFALRF